MLTIQMIQCLSCLLWSNQCCDIDTILSYTLNYYSSLVMQRGQIPTQTPTKKKNTAFLVVLIHFSIPHTALGYLLIDLQRRSCWVFFLKKNFSIRYGGWWKDTMFCYRKPFFFGGKLTSNNRKVLLIVKVSLYFLLFFLSFF